MAESVRPSQKLTATFTAQEQSKSTAKTQIFLFGKHLMLVFRAKYEMQVKRC